jgi:RNA polymerase sigma-70 factor (ECF subfamily)
VQPALELEAVGFGAVHALSGFAMTVPGEQLQALDSFLAERQGRALITAELATRDREAALDIVQDSMLAFVGRYAEKPMAQWGPLFHRVLQNRIVDWHRRQKTQRGVFDWFRTAPSGDSEGPSILDRAPIPARHETQQVVADQAASDALVDAVGCLPQRQQQAFVLRFWEGLDVASTARAMGCSAGSVKTHLSRALAQLRQRLEDHYDH